MAVPAQPNALVEAPGRPSEGSQITCKLVTSLPAPYRVSESPVVGHKCCLLTSMLPATHALNLVFLTGFTGKHHPLWAIASGQSITGAG